MTIDLAAAWREVRARMMEVALPDSRFDMDLDSFIPAYAGVDSSSEGVASRPEFAAAATVFITPDNSMQVLRHLALAAGKTVLIPTYGLKRGFLKLDPTSFDPSLALYASWGDGGAGDRRVPSALVPRQRSGPSQRVRPVPLPPVSPVACAQVIHRFANR